MAEKKLLVADDSLTIQKVIRLALANEGYKIQAVSDGNEACQQIALFRPDVVLIDVSLPGKSAAEVKVEIDAISGNDPSAPRFVLMSSAFEQVNEAEIEALRFHGRLIKPFDPAHLRMVLGNVLNASPVPEMPAAPTVTAGAPGLPPVPPSLKIPPPPPKSMEPQQTRPASAELPIFSEDLWDKKAAASDSSSEAAGSVNEAGPEDIRQLTEQTIKLSGLDHFQWDINEPAKKKQKDRPSLAGEQTLTNLQIQEPTLKPPANLADLSGVTLTWSGTEHAGATANDPLSLYKNAPEDTGEFSRPSDPLVNDAIEPIPSPVPPPFTGPITELQMDVTKEIRQEQTPAIALSTQQMEELISKQLGKNIEQIAERLLPEIAERVLREEIHRLLSNPP